MFDDLSFAVLGAASNDRLGGLSAENWGHTWAILTYFLGFTLLLPLCLWLTPKDVTDRLTLAHSILWTPVLPLMLYYTFRGVFELKDTLESRWFKSTPAAEEFMRIYNASQLLGTLIEFLIWGEKVMHTRKAIAAARAAEKKAAGLCGVAGASADAAKVEAEAAAKAATDASGKSEFLKLVPILTHHLLSLTAYTFCLFNNGQMVFWGCLDGLCEVTNIHLSILMASKTKGGWVAKWMEDTFGALLMVNGFFLWLTFLVFRMVLFPAWLILFGMDMYVMPLDMWNRLTSFELVFYPAVTLFLFVLSSLWFFRINEGLMKALRAGGDMAKTGYEGGAGTALRCCDSCWWWGCCASVLCVCAVCVNERGEERKVHG